MAGFAFAVGLDANEIQDEMHIIYYAVVSQDTGGCIFSEYNDGSVSQ